MATINEPSSPASGTAKPSTPSGGAITDVVKSAAKGAAAGGGVPGAVAGAAKGVAGVAVKNPKVQKVLLVGLAGLVAIATMAGLGLVNMVTAASSDQHAGVRSRAGTAATSAGAAPNQVSYLTDQADAAGIAWEVVVAAFKAQQFAYGGIGPWHLKESEAAAVPAPEGSCPASVAQTSQTATPTTTPTASGRYPGAENMCAASRWVIARLNTAMATTGELDRRLDLGDGAVVDKTGNVTWTTPALFTSRIVDPYSKALAKLPLEGANELWGKGVTLTAVYWHLGLQPPCTGLGASDLSMIVAPGSWTNPTIDADGMITGTATFGMRTHPITGELKLHAGVDIGNVRGTAIWATAAGTVTLAKDGCAEGDQSCNNGAGNYVDIDHGGGITTRYLHMQANSLTVKAGDAVAPGRQIGLMGSTGMSTDPHLHFETRVNDVPVDPIPFMLQRGVDLTKPPAASATSTSPSPTTPAPSAAPTGSAATNPTSLTSRSTTGVTYTYGALQINNAAMIIGYGQQLHADNRIILAALATAAVESDFRQLANDGNPESMSYPNDGVAHSQGSVGTVKDSLNMFQQRPSMGWGTVRNLMQKPYAIGMFYGGPTKPQPGYDPPGALDILTRFPDLINNPGALAQKVQGSEFPDRYAEMMPIAQDMLRAVSGILVSGAFGNAGFCSATTGTFYGGNFPTSTRNVGSTAMLTANAIRVEQIIAALFPEVTSVLGYRQDAVDPNGHPAGKGLDVMIPGWDTPAGVALGDRVAAFLTTNYRELDVKYLVWRQRQWDPGTGTWTPMPDRGDPTSNHMDHVHITLNS